MSDDFISNVIAFLALLLSIYSLWQTKKSEKNRDRAHKVFELEQKLDFILANKDDEIIRYKVETYQKDLSTFCEQYKLNAGAIFRAYARIYVPLTNDGEDVSLDLKKVCESASELINLLK
ncbi:hypothetical protein MY806_06355 [Haemophilus influenzae]|nr:hypothetical protein [Haemophilus influenzae]MCK9009384.1 hypothetical protein [Haemophilus influenzae]MCK9011083.1 hypothetical protein [Haemophilus influenzae]